MLKPGIIASGLSVFLYGLIFWSVNRGVSVDEGYYLLGYLADQPIKYALTDFHHIVRATFFFLPEDNALLLRIIRVILTLSALYFFAHSSIKWLRKEYPVQINKLAYFSLSFLTGTLCFAYASPVLYYDNMQMIIYLVSFAFIFEILLDRRPFIRLLYAFLLGFLLIFALTNYLPAGVFLFIMVILILGIFLRPVYSGALRTLFVVLGGFVTGLIVYHFFIHDIRDVAEGIMGIYTSASDFEVTKYETGGQFSIIVRYFTDLFITLLPIVIGSTFYFFLRKYINKYAILFDIFFLVITAFLVYSLSFDFSNVILLPIVVAMTAYVFENKFSVKGKIPVKNIILLCIFLAVPLLGVLGSNQLLARKMFFFMPFWFLALYYFLAEFRKSRVKTIPDKYQYLLILTVSIVFFFQGFIRHPHYNYSIRRSKYPIENAVRFKGIKVSQYQNSFYFGGISLEEMIAPVAVMNGHL